jgi:hypothetical protein
MYLQVYGLTILGHGSTDFNTIWNSSQQQSRTTVQKYFLKKVHPCVIDSINPNSTRADFTLTARPLLTPPALKQCSCEYGLYSRTENVFIMEHCIHRNCLLLFVKQLAMWILKKKFPKIQHKDWQQNFETQDVLVCDECSSSDKTWNYDLTDFKQCISCNNSKSLLFFTFCTRRYQCVVVRGAF